MDPGFSIENNYLFTMFLIISAKTLHKIMEINCLKK